MQQPQQQQKSNSPSPPPLASSSGDNCASSAGTAGSDKDRQQNRARIQAYYVTHEPFQVAQLKKEQRERERAEAEAEAEVERGVEAVVESTINLGTQQSTTTQDPLDQVPRPFVLPDTTPRADPQSQTPQTTATAAMGLPLIVSSSAESNEAPQVVNAPDYEHARNGESAVPASNGSSGSGSASSAGSAVAEKPTSADSNTGTTAGKLGGLLSNWAPGAAALTRPLSMQRSLSGLFGLRSPAAGIAQQPLSEPVALVDEGGRKMSQCSMTSDESSLLLMSDEGGKSGVVYHRVALHKRNEANVTSAAGGERRPRLPAGASGIVLHKDLWKLDQMSERCDLPECSTVFSFTNRRHHCRMCGQIFCTPHASYALDLWYPPTGTSEEGLRSGKTSRRGSGDEPQGVSRSQTTTSTTTMNEASDLTASLLRLPARRNVVKDGVVKPSRVCVDCYDRVWNPEKLARREKTRRAVHHDDGAAGTSTTDPNANDSDSQASHSGFSLVLDTRAAVGNNLNERVLHRSRSSQGTGRRMFSAPTSPASTSPTHQGNALDGAMVGLAMGDSVASLSRTGSRASSLAPPGARQNRRLARNASAHGALSLPPLRPGSACDSITRRPMFSPTAEALNIHAQQRSSLSPNSSAAGGNGYFPAMPPPSKPFLPGEEPNQHVNGVLSNYPLAYKPAPASGSTVTSPFASRPPSSADLSGMARRMAGQGTGRQGPAHMRIDLPNGGYAFDDHLSSKASSARLLTPEREWVPGAWGYAKETFDPDVESDTEDDEDSGDVCEVDSLAKRARSRLIVDGDIRLKTRAGDVRQTATAGQHTTSHAQSSSGTRLMPWSTF